MDDRIQSNLTPDSNPMSTSLTRFWNHPVAGWRADKMANCRLERPTLLEIMCQPVASLKKFHSVCSMRSGFPIQDHSTIRATFMWDRSIMCLWKFEKTVNTNS